MKDDEYEEFYDEEEIGHSDESEKESLVENDEMEAWEEGFLQGAEGGGQRAKCRKCGKILTEDNTIEKEFEGELCWFCSEECLDKFEEEKMDE